MKILNLIIAATLLWCNGTLYAESVGQLVTRAQHRDVAAMRTLGIRMYKGGYAGIPTNRKVGLQWLNMAANEDDDVALLFLGDIYAKGFHVPMDKGKAEDFYRRAMENGNQNAKERLAKLQGKSKSKTRSSSLKDDDDELSDDEEENDGEKNTQKKSSAKLPKEPALKRLIVDSVDIDKETPLTEVIDAIKLEGKRKNVPVTISYISDPAIGEQACVDTLIMEKCTAMAVLQEACEQSGCEMKISEDGATIRQVKAVPRKSKPLTYEERQRLLMQTISEGDAGKVEEMLSKPLNLSYLNNDDLSPLMFAVKRDQIRIATMLLTKGANVNQVNHRGETALLLAVESSHSSAVKMLIDHGADVNRRYEHQGTVLMHAVARESAPIARMLLSAGANADAADDENITAAILAEATGNQTLINLFPNPGEGN